MSTLIVRSCTGREGVPRRCWRPAPARPGRRSARSWSPSVASRRVDGVGEGERADDGRSGPRVVAGGARGGRGAAPRRSASTPACAAASRPPLRVSALGRVGTIVAGARPARAAGRVAGPTPAACLSAARATGPSVRSRQDRAVRRRSTGSPWMAACFSHGLRCCSDSPRPPRADEPVIADEIVVARDGGLTRAERARAGVTPERGAAAGGRRGGRHGRRPRRRPARAARGPGRGVGGAQPAALDRRRAARRAPLGARQHRAVRVVAARHGRTRTSTRPRPGRSAAAPA